MSDSNSGDERYALTPVDRQFIRGEKTITESEKAGEEYITERSAQNARTRIRTRFRCILDDLDTLSRNPLAWNPDKLTEGMSADRDDETYQNLVSAVGLIYLLASRSNIDTERLFSEGVLAGAGRFARDASVDIEVDYPREEPIGEIISKLRSGKMPDPWEIGILYYHGFHRKEIKFADEYYEVQELIDEFAESRDLETDGIATY